MGREAELRIVSEPPASLEVVMGAVIDLGAWRQEREPEARLQRALDQLDEALVTRGEKPPEWLKTEMLAALGSRHLGEPDEAARRLERAAERLMREDRRRARRP
jgi:hypothetical protein